MFIDMVITRSMRIMATMLNTGVSLLDTLEVIRASCDNYYFQRLWHQASDKIHDGYQLSEAILIVQGVEGQGKRDNPSPRTGMQLIDAGIIQMFRAGEKSGKLGSVSDKISVFYEKKLEMSIKSVMTLIEPIMITVLGTIIGTIAIALLLPVFRISTVIAH
jgi:type IV pilus assembly protein PilC